MRALLNGVEMNRSEGQRMIWDRAEAGVSAKQFQALLEAKLAENAVSCPVAAKPARAMILAGRAGRECGQGTCIAVGKVRR
jgi:hypothetical protein